MQTHSTAVAMIIDDEPAVRALQAAIVSDYGCAVVTSENDADMRRRITDFPPDIIFLDIGLRHTDAFELLTTLGALSFPGVVQIVSGQHLSLLDQAFRAGSEQGLRMRRPLAKPFRTDDLERILSDEGLLGARPDPDKPDIEVVQRAWTCSLSRASGLIDLSIRLLEKGCESRPGPVEQLRGWTTQLDRYRPALLDLPAPSTVCVDMRMADIHAIAPDLSHSEHHASHPAVTIVLDEEDVFNDLDEARELLCFLRMSGATIRVTGCGTRFFAMAGHQPLPVDQAVLGAFLQLERDDRVFRTMSRLAATAHRAGTLLLVDDLPDAADTDRLAVNGADLWRSVSHGWQEIVPIRPQSMVRRDETRQNDVWRPWR